LKRTGGYHKAHDEKRLPAFLGSLNPKASAGGREGKGRCGADDSMAFQVELGRGDGEKIFKTGCSVC